MPFWGEVHHRLTLDVSMGFSASLLPHHGKALHHSVAWQEVAHFANLESAFPNLVHLITPMFVPQSSSPENILIIN